MSSSDETRQTSSANSLREMTARVCEFDWSSTPLGAMHAWPAELRIAVDICLNSRFPMFVWWGPQLINIYNDGYAPMLGTRHPAALGRPARDSWNEIWDVVGPQAEAVMQRGEATWNERVRLVLERKGFSEDTYFTWSYSPIRDNSGDVGGLFCAVTEETARVRAEVALLESNEQARLLVDTARQLGSSLDPDAIYLRLRETIKGAMPLGGLVISVYDPADGYIRCSHAWLSGNVLDPTKFPPIRFNPNDTGGMQTQVIRTGKPLLFNDVVQRVSEPKGQFYEVNADGSMRDLKKTGPANVRSAIMVPVFSQGAVVGVVQVMSNSEEAYTDRELALLEGITLQLSAALENARLYRRVNEAKEAAEAASRAKGEFLATLSHELRTPLTPVLLLVSLMERHPNLPDDLRADVATIRRSVELESRLISDLLDLTRIERGKLQLDEHDVDLHLIIRAAADICRRDASAELTMELGATQHAVRGDSTRLQQVFWNLINNAIKFTPRSGSVTVRSMNTEDGQIRVEVIDTGEGIDPAVLPKLFTAFEQGDVRTARKFAGLGLGLAISRKLVEAHQGSIVASSDGRGCGSSFAVELPVVAQFAPVEVMPKHPTPPLTPVQPLNVLLIEDHEPTLRALEQLLRQVGHRVTGVTTLTSANAESARSAFDLIISDLGLPDGSGLDLMRQLRHQYSGRAIALSGYGMESDIAASREAGFAEHLTKPVDLQQLQSAIARVTTVCP